MILKVTLQPTVKGLWKCVKPVLTPCLTKCFCSIHLRVNTPVRVKYRPLRQTVPAVLFAIHRGHDLVTEPSSLAMRRSWCRIVDLTAAIWPSWSSIAESSSNSWAFSGSIHDSVTLHTVTVTVTDNWNYEEYATISLQLIKSFLVSQY